MSLESWNPQDDAAAPGIRIEADTLERFISYSRDEQLQELQPLLAADSEQLAGLMQLEHSLWRDAVADLPETDIVHLIRFLTVVEKLPGWEAGEKSPVIALAKVLRQRGQRLDKALLLWLREVSDNRFLPYGPL